MRRHLPFPLHVALRYLRSTRRDAFIRFLSAVTGAGITLGVAALVLALAALSGFQEALKGEILARTPEIEVELPPEAEAAALRDRLQGLPEIDSVQLLIRGRGWLLAGGRARPAELVGYAGDLPALFPGASGREPGVYLGDRVATAWGLGPGDVLEVLSTRPTLTPWGPQPRVRRLTLTGTFSTGRTEQQERLALPLEQAEALLGEGDRRLLLTIGDLDEALELAPGLSRWLPEGSVVRTWSDLNRALLFALRLEKGLMFVAVFLIVVVAAMSLVSDLTLILASKQAEVGMLGAMGADPASLERVFLWLGGLLVGLGTALGVTVGVAGAWLLDRYRLFSLPEEVYFLDYVPFLVRAVDVLAILAATTLLTFWGTLYAARRAAALEPVEALRR
ncbi:MAG: FtsX-like permease family protein [Thermoanaerobaculia bacterium]